jgi:hypothetical protein
MDEISMNYIDLDRTFNELNENTLDLKESNYFTELSDDESKNWEWLLQHSLVLLLAEAGSGKTKEMEEQVEKICKKGGNAFFLPLESIDTDDLSSLFPPNKRTLFRSWQTNKEKEAYFFLDAVDELKLKEGKIDIAIRHFFNAIENDIARINVIISCRPSDWRKFIDMTTLRKWLPLPKKVIIGDISEEDEDEFALLSPEEYFIKLMEKGESSPSIESENISEDDDSYEPITIVSLAPLNNVQIKLYSQYLGVTDPDEFIRTINRFDLQGFASRPLDLEGLALTWKEHGELLSLQNQHEADLKSKLKETYSERTDSSTLNEKESLDALGIIALNMSLFRSRSLCTHNDISNDTNIIEISSIDALNYWTRDKQSALFRKAIFDPATYGRVKFHHRSIQEYLAAKRLNILLSKGLSYRKLSSLLFSKLYDYKLVIPFMKPIAAWLSLWNERIFNELLKVEPEALINEGDPSSFNLEQKTRIIRCFIDRYGDGKEYGVNLNKSQIIRLSCPELADTITECWGDSGPKSEDAKSLLIELIRNSPLTQYKNILASIVFDESNSSYLRTLSVYGLTACEDSHSLIKLKDQLIKGEGNWSADYIRNILPELYPSFLCEQELISLIENNNKESKETHSYNRLAFALSSVFKNINNFTEKHFCLAKQLAFLIVSNRVEKCRIHDIKSKFSDYTSQLAYLSLQLFKSNLTFDKTELIKIATISIIYNSRSGSVRESIKELKTFLSTHFKEEAFWQSLDIIDEIYPSKDKYHRASQIFSLGVIDYLNENDIDWLLKSVNHENIHRKIIALYNLIWLDISIKNTSGVTEQISSAVSIDKVLTNIWDESQKPKKVEKDEYDLEHEKWVVANKVKEKSRIEGWKEWRLSLLNEPNLHFESDEIEHTIRNFWSVLSSVNKAGNEYDRWSSTLLSKIFNKNISQKAKASFKHYWRTQSPLLWSEKAKGDKNSTLYTSIYGLVGIYIESKNKNWTLTLSENEAKQAVRHSTVELNGFAPFIEDLVLKHPRAVEEILGGELTSQLEQSTESKNIPMLQDIDHSNHDLKLLLNNRLLSYLKNKKIDHRNITFHSLDYIFKILSDSLKMSVDLTILSICKEYYQKYPEHQLANVWLKGVFLVNSYEAINLHLEVLKTIKNPKKHFTLMLSFFFGRDSDIELLFVNDDEKSECLGKLVKIAYEYIRLDEDLVHEGSYTPNTRDDAERGRENLLSMLLQTPCKKSTEIFCELLKNPSLAAVSDRGRIWLRVELAKRADQIKLSQIDINNIEQYLSELPKSKEQLFDLMTDRLKDIEHDIIHSDFSERNLLLQATKESDIQSSLANKLDNISFGMYRVSRESEVADSKRPDIHLYAVEGNQKTVIELKLADNWTVKELVRALENQLVGQYLRHVNCRSGCLFLSYHGRKTWRNPETNQKMSFEDVVRYLKEKALAHNLVKSGDILLSVFGLNLTPPILPKAH